MATGLKKETSAAMSVMFAPTLIVPVLFLLLDKNKFVRFYTVQVLVLGLSMYVLRVVSYSFLYGFSSIVSVVGFTLWLVLIYKAWQGVEWEIPFLGKISRQLVSKL